MIAFSTSAGCIAHHHPHCGILDGYKMGRACQVSLLGVIDKPLLVRDVRSEIRPDEVSYFK